MQELRAPGHVRPIAVAGRVQRCRAERDVERRPCLRAEDPVDLPAAEEPARRAVLEPASAGTEGQLVDVALNEHVSAVERRAGAILADADVVEQTTVVGRVVDRLAVRIGRGQEQAQPARDVNGHEPEGGLPPAGVLCRDE